MTWDFRAGRQLQSCKAHKAQELCGVQGKRTSRRFDLFPGVVHGWPGKVTMGNTRINPWILVKSHLAPSMSEWKMSRRKYERRSPTMIPGRCIRLSSRLYSSVLDPSFVMRKHKRLEGETVDQGCTRSR